MKNVKLADIAQETGFSVNTVSRALHDKPDISEKTKKYIIETADRIGYISNISASALRSGQSKSIAIIIGDISNPHFSIMIKEIEARLRIYGYGAFIMNTDENENVEKEAIISAISKNADGIIICPVQKTTANIDFIARKKIPYVLLGRRLDDLSSSYVICDDIHSGFAAAEHLIKLNHQDILFINAPQHISSAADRLSGILAAFKEYSIDTARLHTETSGITGDVSSIEAILKNHTDCTGIICFSDLIALNVCYCLTSLGKSVPDDVSVIGFDNICSKYKFPLMLTSVSSLKTQMSLTSVDTLMNLIDGSSSTVRHILHTHVIERDSTAKKKC